MSSFTIPSTTLTNAQPAAAAASTSQSCVDFGIPTLTRINDKVPTYHMHWTIDNDSIPGPSQCQAVNIIEQILNKTKETPGPSRRSSYRSISNISYEEVKEYTYNAEGQRWRLTLLRRNSTLRMSVEVCNGPEELWVSSKFWLVDGDYAESLATRADINITDPQIKVGNITRENHMFEIPRTFKPHNNKLTLLVEISILGGIGDTWHQIKVPPCSLRDDFRVAIDLCGEMEGKDITLVAKPTEYNSDLEGEKTAGEGIAFGAHKFILAARSPVFAAMFKHRQLRENEKSEVEITDIEPDVLKELLTFIYTGDTPNIKKMSSSLLYAAEKYQLNHLKAICERQLAVSITVQNAAETLVLAHKFEAHQLKKVALEFIALNGGGVLKTDGWKSVKAVGTDLVTEVLDTIYNSLDVQPPAKRRKAS